MSFAATRTDCRWLRTGDEAFREMLGAIDAAQAAVCLETYTFTASPLGERFRAALVQARQRGARVRILVDAIGSFELSEKFWEPLRAAGGEVRVFNPLTLGRGWIRNHRKLLVCDGLWAFVGGANIAPEFEGDGIAAGWCDVGLKVTGPLAGRLGATFEDMFARAEFRQKKFARLRRFEVKPETVSASEQILLGGPGRGQGPIKAALRADLAAAGDVQIMVAYFLPTWRLRRALTRVARRGGRVRLLLAGQSDVRVAQQAARSLYRRLLKNGVEIFEYQPQVLHAKLVIVDDAVYVGSANLDQRSLQINYELMVRFQDAGLAAQAREIFAERLRDSRRIEAAAWRQSRTLWQKVEQRLAYLLLARLDPYLARRQWKSLPD